jgi:hypothetical protein
MHGRFICLGTKLNEVFAKYFHPAFCIPGKITVEFSFRCIFEKKYEKCKTYPSSIGTIINVDRIAGCPYCANKRMAGQALELPTQATDMHIHSARLHVAI